MEFESVLGKSRYTVAWIIQKLKESDEKFRILESKNKILKIEETNLSGIGYMSFIIRLTFYFGNNDNNEERNDKTFKVICKIPTTDMIYKNFKRSSENNHSKNGTNHNKKSNELKEFLTKAHNRECFVYSSIVSNLGIKVPKIYFFEEKNDERERDGCIVMEDISEKGALQNVLKEINYQQVEAVIKSIAKMHAKSQTLPQKFFQNLKFDNIIKVPKDCLKGITKLESKIIQKYKIELEEIWEQEEEIVDSHLKYGIPSVVSHGDCWINNIFFYKNESGKASNEFYTLLDWQLTHRGNGLNDIARFLTVSVEAEMLEKHRSDFLQIYYKSFNEKCLYIFMKTYIYKK
uniref:CHK kinase-like domain-containing protein n=1 Tax=Panagrolaimus superbus TaxID=310955 RepID=A0A914Z007_9BILA